MNLIHKKKIYDCLLMVYKIHYTRYCVLSPYTLNQTLNTASITEDYGHCYGYASANPVNCVNWLFKTECAVSLWNEPITVNEGACVAMTFGRKYVRLGLKDEAITANEGACVAIPFASSSAYRCVRIRKQQRTHRLFGPNRIMM
eukprot:245917_1